MSRLALQPKKGRRGFDPKILPIVALLWRLGRLNLDISTYHASWYQSDRSLVSATATFLKMLRQLLTQSVVEPFRLVVCTILIVLEIAIALLVPISNQTVLDPSKYIIGTDIATLVLLLVAAIVLWRLQREESSDRLPSLYRELFRPRRSKLELISLASQGICTFLVNLATMYLAATAGASPVFLTTILVPLIHATLVYLPLVSKQHFLLWAARAIEAFSWIWLNIQACGLATVWPNSAILTLCAIASGRAALLLWKEYNLTQIDASPLALLGFPAVINLMLSWFFLQPLALKATALTRTPWQFIDESTSWSFVAVVGLSGLVQIVGLILTLHLLGGSDKPSFVASNIASIFSFARNVRSVPRSTSPVRLGLFVAVAASIYSLYRTLFDPKEPMDDRHLFRGPRFRTRIILSIFATVALVLPMSMPLLTRPDLYKQNLCKTCLDKDNGRGWCHEVGCFIGAESMAPSICPLIWLPTNSAPFWSVPGCEPSNWHVDHCPAHRTDEMAHLSLISKRALSPADQSKFLRFWGPIFSYIQFIQPPSFKDTKKNNVITCDNLDKTPAYQCWADSILGESEYSGFFLARSGVVMNYWNFPHRINNLWITWRKVHALVPCDQLAQASRPALVRKQLDVLYSSASQTVKRQLDTTFGEDWSQCIDAPDMSAFYYLPYQYVNSFVKYAKIFAPAALEASVALPMITQLISADPAREWVNITSNQYVFNEGFSQIGYTTRLVWFGEVDPAGWAADEEFFERALTSAVDRPAHLFTFAKQWLREEVITHEVVRVEVVPN